MRNKLILSSLCLSLGVLAVGCNNQDKKSETTEAHDDHAGHDHSAHDHSTHEHAATEQSTQTNPAPAAPQTTKAAALSIPEFNFYKVKSGISYSKADIPAGKNTVFVLFDPGCSHCQNETKGLAKNYDKIKDINVLYVSMNDPALMAQFFTTFGKELEGKENVQMLWDRNQEFVQKFHIPNMFPSNYVYGPDGQLKSYWEGEKDINEVIAEFKK
jgi:peroxiredoxin